MAASRLQYLGQLHKCSQYNLYKSLKKRVTFKEISLLMLVSYKNKYNSSKKNLIWIINW